MTQMKIQAKCQMVFAFLCVNLKIFYYTTFIVYIVERIPYLFYSPQSKKKLVFLPISKACTNKFDICWQSMYTCCLFNI